jgi:hypothetical protein
LKLCNFTPLNLTLSLLTNKLIWDFRGPFRKTAEHHEIHLKEYIVMENCHKHYRFQGEMQAIAFMVVTDENMIQVRDALKPHRGEVYAG